MAAHLLAAALYCDDSSTITDCEAAACDRMDENPLQEAMCHTATEGIHVASDAAISHRSCVGPKKGGKKKRQSGVAGVGKSAKIRKVDLVFTPASEDDGKLQCIFVEGECIPLWPQYLHRTTVGNFIRVDTQEYWVIQLMVACRKSVLRGYEPHGHGEQCKPRSRALVKSVCNELLHEFRRVLVEARKEHRKSASEQFPDALAIRVQDCEVIASAHARQFYIRADEKAVKWIHIGLRRAVTGYLDVELRAMSRTASKCCDDKLISQMQTRAGVRDKIHWMPEKCSWGLTFKGAMGGDTEYCNEHGIRLHIEQSLQESEFKVGRGKAFHDACQVWNAIDKSGKKRITMPERLLKVDMAHVLTSKAMSHTDSEHETEVPSGSYDEEDLFGDGAE